MDWAKAGAKLDEKHLSYGTAAPYIRDFTVIGEQTTNLKVLAWYTTLACTMTR